MACPFREFEFGLLAGSNLLNGKFQVKIRLTVVFKKQLCRIFLKMIMHKFFQCGCIDFLDVQLTKLCSTRYWAICTALVAAPFSTSSPDSCSDGPCN
jgi:hypothetical protein